MLLQVDAQLTGPGSAGRSVDENAYNDVSVSELRRDAMGTCRGRTRPRA